jgi:hypothetical protein
MFFARIISHVAVMTVLGSLSLAAQDARGHDTPGDSSAAANVNNPWPQRAWIGVGLGGGTFPHGAISLIADGWYSVGAFAIGARLGGAEALFGEQRSDRALLLGGRTPGNHWFLLGAAGIGTLASSRTCDGPCSALTRPSRTAIAYTLEAHGSLALVGVGLAMFGALGPAETNYNAIAVTLNAGWFGR